jgi:signal transduction histidine kinase
MEGDRLKSDVETALYRVTQEALTNVAKHARATHVSVLVERRPDYTSLIIEDDGIGFAAKQPGSPPKGVGLIGMRERVMVVRGTFEIESLPGGGTTIAVRIPFA